MSRITREELEWYNDFEEAANLNASHYPWLQRREGGWIYARFFIADSDDTYWYRDFVGIEYLGLLSKYTGNRLQDIQPVKMIGRTKIVIGRSISLGNVILN